MYQSYKVVSEPHPDVRPHDFMDDLESFFYVWCHVTFLYDGGRPMQRTSSHLMLHDWNSRRRNAANAKRSFLLDDDVPPDTPLIGLDTDTCDVVGKLIDSLRAVFTKPQPRCYRTSWRFAGSHACHRLLGKLQDIGQKGL